MGSRATAACPISAIATTEESSLAAESRPTLYCLARTVSPRFSNAGSWALTRAESVVSISTTTSMSSRSASIDEPHGIAGSSSTGFWNRLWSWTLCPTRRWSRAYAA